MDTEVSANKTRGPRRVGLKRPSYSGKAVDSLNSSAAEDVERKTVSPAAPLSTDNESKSLDISADLRLDSSNVESVDTKAEPRNGDKESASKINKESNEENGSSEDSEEFCGFQPAPETKPIRVLTKLLGEAQSELDSENNMSAEEEKMDVDPEIDDAKRVAHNITDDGIVKSTKKRKLKEDAIDENGSASEDDKTKEADGSFDNMKLLSEVSSEVTSSNDVTNTNTNDISAKATEEVASEVTSSATNSPSLSTSRSSVKAMARKGQESPATVSRRSIAKKSTVDLSSPAFRKPFDYGWKRELVYRNSNESSARVMADVYYYTPGNKKIRSNREVSDHLRGTDLTTDNFTFFKEALGVEDPEKEIIRVAKRVSGVGGLSLPKSPQVKKLPTPKTPKTPREPKEVKDSSKNSSPDTSSTEAKAAAASGPRAASRTFPRIKITPSQLMRTSAAAASGGGKAKGKKIRSPSDDGDMEMGMLPPNWNQATVKSSSKKRKRDVEKDAAGAAAPVPAKRGKKSHDQCELEQAAMRGFANNVAAGYNAMLQVFQYLKVKELSRAAQVCKMWRDLAGHPSLWRIVRMKNSQVDDWEGFVTALVKRNAHTLDMRKMLLPNDLDEIAKMWRSFLREVSRATSLARVDLCRCPAAVIEALPAACPQLTVINALAVKCSSISLDSMAHLADLHELRLKSMTGIHLSSSLEPLRKFTNLRHLALTTFKDLGKAEPEVISCLTNLETLELGECSDFAEQFGREVIPKLTKLTSLRLEKGQGKTCPTFSLLGGVKELPSLNQLELVNFDVKPGFSEALAQCTNIKRLLIIPTYVTQSATTNHMVLMGVTELKESLSHFVWGVTHELLRVTELFIDQCDQQTMPKDSKPPKASKHPDSIPILKPDKSKAPEWDSADCKSMNSPVGQVEILTLAKLQQVLVKSLPNTKIKILKVPFQSTWRQSISEPNA